MTKDGENAKTIEWLLEDLAEVEKTFDNLLSKAPINYDALDAATRRFREVALDIVGDNTLKAETYKKWQAYPALGLITSDTPDSAFYDAYHRGAETTMGEIASLKSQLSKRQARVAPKESSPVDELQTVLRICERLPMSAKALTDRQRDKPDYTVDDEYDVQDLLMAVMKAYFKYIIQEDPMNKIGSSSGRADFSIEELGIVIEVKFARRAGDQKRIEEEFAVDQNLYSTWSHLKHFVYVVYGANKLKDHELLERQAGPKSLNGRDFLAHVVCC